ncbi:hypothetical protein ACMHYB_57775 [Sorangium sp. So ce1128]
MVQFVRQAGPAVAQAVRQAGPAAVQVARQAGPAVMQAVRQAGPNLQTRGKQAVEVTTRSAAQASHHVRNAAEVTKRVIAKVAGKAPTAAPSQPAAPAAAGSRASGLKGTDFEKWLHAELKATSTNFKTGGARVRRGRWHTVD